MEKDIRSDVKRGYMPIIGLEAHIQLKTKSKMFCGCAADWFGKKPNTLTCPVCLGLPGALPVPNRKAVEWTVMLGLALNCSIAAESKFDRKNYFYPDLPKGYQISQYDMPIAANGYLKLQAQSSRPEADRPLAENFKGTGKNSKLENNQTIKIRRAHLEEDTAKLLHKKIKGKKATLIDFNRSGMPLVEIVTEPDIRSSAEAVEFLKKLRQIVRYLGISDADMEKGSMRIEPNVSILKISNKFQIPNYKVEIKNINSFRFARRAIDYEIKRQIKLIKQGKIPKQETRGWDEKKQKTLLQRVKEEAHDYRYFPEPDIPPLVFSKTYINRLKSAIPELPNVKINRFIKEYKISEYYAKIITKEKSIANYYEKAAGKEKTHAKAIANWIVNKKVDLKKVSPTELAKLVKKEAQKQEIPQRKIEKIIKTILKQNKKAAEDYKKGKEAALGFLVGKVIGMVKSKVSGKEVRQLLKKQLEIRSIEHE